MLGVNFYCRRIWILNLDRVALIDGDTVFCELLDCGIQFFYCVFRIVPSIKTIAGLVFGIPYFDLHAVGVDLFLYDFTIVGACREGCVGSVDLEW